MAAEMNKTTKVGIISCSGEEIPEGTISRNAVRRVLESLRPHDAVTLCLPLFLAGNEGERNFARTHPTITIDGCDKQCARWGTEKHGGPVARAWWYGHPRCEAQPAARAPLRGRGRRPTKGRGGRAERIAAEVDALMSGELARGGSDDETFLSDTFKALSDETRLQIMTLLLEHEELCVCDFVGRARADAVEGLASSPLPLPRRAGAGPPRGAVDALSHLPRSHTGAGDHRGCALRGGRRGAETGTASSAGRWFARKAAAVEARGQGAASCC